MSAAIVARFTELKDGLTITRRDAPGTLIMKERVSMAANTLSKRTLPFFTTVLMAEGKKGQFPFSSATSTKTFYTLLPWNTREMPYQRMNFQIIPCRALENAPNSKSMYTLWMKRSTGIFKRPQKNIWKFGYNIYNFVKQ